MNLTFPLIGRGRMGSFETFFDRKIREQRRDERRLAEPLRYEASAPGEKLMRCRRTKLSHC